MDTQQGGAVHGVGNDIVSHASASLCTAADEASVFGQGPVDRAVIEMVEVAENAVVLPQIHNAVEETGEFDPLDYNAPAGANELADGDNESGTGNVDRAATDDDVDSPPSKRLKI
ncbi:uncharacterized protein LOC125525471 [Triticum urartu]|uniref:uncharacterized protein LOC125525471 n=1 Tax=Triticum urartu TaxID=4572 RepID=UPI002044C7C4|nr:uncharacterized protein LOC125525471 [Triticum urartu]